MKKEHIMLLPEAKIRQILKLDLKDIPSFPPVMAKMIALSNNRATSLKDLGNLIETDPGMSAKVLRTANSALYGLLRKIRTVPEAVTYLGLDEVKKLALNTAVFEGLILKGRSKTFDRLFFWRHCLCVAILSMRIAEAIHHPNPQEAYVCGLLHDIGKIVFDLAGRADYGKFIRHMSLSTTQGGLEEHQIMGTGHEDLGAHYFVRWQLPDTVALTAKYHHRQYSQLNLPTDKAQLIAIVSLANFLAWTQGMGSLPFIRLPVLQPEVETTIIPDNIDLKRIIRQMDNEMANISRFYNFIFPSASQFRESLLIANLKLSSINTRHHYINGTPSCAASEIRDSITAPHHSLNPEKIIRTTIKALDKDFGFDRIYVLKMDKTRQYLKTIAHLDSTGNDSQLAAVKLPVNRDSGGFIRCLRHLEPVVITGKTKGEKDALNKLCTSEILIVPFCSHSKIIGVLGMDNPVSQKKFSPQVLPLISVVAGELGMALTHAAAFKKARAISRHDGLTGLLNRLSIDDLLAKAFRNAVDNHNALCIVMIDIDFFKKINDRFGHQGGDHILKLMAATLKKMTRPFDHVGRYGGEEFIVILNNTDIREAMVYAERIRREVEHLGNRLNEKFPGLALTVSLGVSRYNKDTDNKDQLISEADKALYRAKEEGRNRVSQATRTSSSESFSHAQI